MRGARSQATAGTGAAFLGGVCELLLFPVQVIQADGGSELMAEFEQSCQQRRIGTSIICAATAKPKAEWPDLTLELEWDVSTRVHEVV